MRRRAFLGLALATPTVALVGLPTVTSAWGGPRPVTPRVTRLPLTGVDRAAAQRLGGASPALLNAPTETGAFSMLGVTWAPDPGVVVGVRVRTRRDGRWTPWVGLEPQGDHRPDGVEQTGPLRDGTAPRWVGPSDAVQVRLDALSGRRPRDVTVELIDPGTSRADRPAALPRASATAAEPRPPILTRAEWGADESIRRGSPGYTPTVRVGFVHHTASSNDYGPEQAAAMVRGIYAYHVKSNGWSDIGYNFLVDRYGRAYEGRAGGMDRFVLGAHTGGFNANSFGVALLGDFTSSPPPQETTEMLARVLAWKLGTAYRDPRGTGTLTSAGGGTSRYAAGRQVEFDVVSGHRDAGNTSCPGATTYAQLPELRELVASELGAAFVSPALAGGTAFARGAEGEITVAAGTLQDLAWTATVEDRAGAVLRATSGTGGTASLTWDLTDAAGEPARPGTYLVRLQGAAGEDRALPFTETVVIESPACRGAPLQRAKCKAAVRPAAP